MNPYLQSLNEEIREYLKILSPEFPKWLLEYIYTPEMLRLDEVRMSCGTLYTRVYNDKYFYSTLTIAIPTFKHCIDFMNGASQYQESTEKRTESIIKNAKEIMALLKKDNIKIEEVSDYHIYPIADNDSPKLSADRLEYTLSGGLYQIKVFQLKSIEKYYNDIII